MTSGRGRALPCRLEAAPLQDVAEWAKNDRRFRGERYERPDEYLHHQHLKKAEE